MQPVEVVAGAGFTGGRSYPGCPPGMAAWRSAAIRSLRSAESRTKSRRCSAVACCICDSACRTDAPL